MVLIISSFLSKKECQFWKDYCVYANNNDTLEVGLKTAGEHKKVNRNYYTIRTPFKFMDEVKKIAEKNWKQKLNFQQNSYGHIMHYRKIGQGLEWHAEPKISTVSVSINLSNKDEYKGAEFEIKGHKLDLKQGDAIFYDSSLLHRVTPLLHGHKKSLVMWLK